MAETRDLETSSPDGTPESDRDAESSGQPGSGTNGSQVVQRLQERDGERLLLDGLD